MRMINYDYSLNYWTNLFEYLHEKGINIHHTSYEYESFHLYTEVLKEFYKNHPTKKIKQIIKISSPDFDDLNFDENQMNERISFYKDKLLLKKIYALQWMWRSDLSSDKKRINNYNSSSVKIKNYIFSLKKNNQINYFYCFPYTAAFASRIINEDFIDGLVVYRNPYETDYEKHVDSLEAKFKNCIAIRPFLAGDALRGSDDHNCASLIKYAFNKKSVKGVVVSISKHNQVDEIIKSQLESNV